MQARLKTFVMLHKLLDKSPYNFKAVVFYLLVRDAFH